MPSLSQVLGVKKGSNSPSSRQGFVPFGRKLSSASSTSRQHLRSKSDNGTVFCNGRNGSRFLDFSQRSSPVASNGGDYRETYETRYERYRQIYLATSPERELSTLNAAIVNVRKWLKKKHQSLQWLKQQSAAAEPLADNRLQADLTEQQQRQALLEKLVTEAGHQQEAVDVLLDRGRRYLQQRACITLEVDLDNLAFLWNSYFKQLFLLQEQQDTGLSDLEILIPPEGKENILLHSTPVKWKKAKPGTPNRLQLDDTPADKSQLCETLEKSPTSTFSNKGNSSLVSIPSSANLNLSFSEPDQTRSNFADKKETVDESKPGVTDNTVSESLTWNGEQKNNQNQLAYSEKGTEENKNTSFIKKRRVLPKVPPTPQQSRENRALPDNKDKENPEKSQEEAGEKRKPPPRPTRGRVLSATQWLGGNRNGWLKVAGEGAFTSLRRQQPRIERAVRSVRTRSDPGPSSEISANETRVSISLPVTPVGQSPSSSITGKASFCSSGDSQSTAAGEGLLGKRCKEIHNEQQQKQQRTQEQHNADVPQNKHQLQNGDSHDNPKRKESDGIQLQLGLTASEENLKMEIEEALKEINGSFMDTGDNITDFNATESNANNSATEFNTSDSESAGLDDPDHPTGPKRRRMNGDTPSSINSSPLISGDSSLNDTPTSSPAGTLQRDFRQRYKKDELWKAIESNYQYLMDKEIIETCQSTESALTVEEEEDVMPNVSFTEFLKQYQELIDWLNQAQRNTQRTVTSLSEKYLNQTYHEEMLEKCPRREFLSKYSQQLLARFPHLCDQINLRMQRLNTLWHMVEAAVAPQQGLANADSMMQDLECDLAALRRWLNATESRLLPLTIRADWTDSELEERLRHHQVLQQDIESHSRIVSAVLKLSERVEHVERASCASDSPDSHSLQILALSLERRWHGIWLQSLEWQCRLEEAINRRKGLYGSRFNFSSFNLPTLDESCINRGSDLDLRAKGNISSSSNGSLIELSDDSLLFIGGRQEEHQIADSPSPTLTHHPNLPSPKLTNFLDRSSGDSANISECESKMGDSPQGMSLSQGPADLSLSMSSDGETEGRGHVMKVGPEVKDIGYSSESQSNDETESMQQQLALECRFRGIVEVSSDSPLGEKMTLPAPGSVRQDYYCMTHVDLDSTDKTTTDDGNTTDDKENHGKEWLENGVATATRSREVECGTVFVGSVHGSEGGLVASPTDNTTAFSKDNSDGDIVVKSYLESSDEVDGEGRPAQVRDIPSAIQQGSLSESDSATDSQEKIRYLIDHAEDLVKTSPPVPAVPSSPKRKMSPSKQTQTVRTETSSVESSCDASSENSEESGAEEFSTATDDADETLFDSVINLNSTLESVTSREDVSNLVTPAVTVDSARLRKQTGPRGSKKDRPWSVVGFQDLKKVDFQPLSTSESAIDRLQPHTDTDSSSSMQFMSPLQASTFPRRGRNQRGFQRAFSACEQSSPRANKRKLKYSSSSSATDSQTSRSSGTRVAGSDDESTLLYESVGRRPCLLESESETTDEYVTASMDEMMTSADEDPHNSTGSFSENAWDNYQMMYPTASEDATEEVLHWEPVDDMEFDDDFNFNFPKEPSLLSEAISKRTSKLRLKGMCGGGEDSDSDMEDFRSVLDDSEMCLKKADHSLKKKRSNPMGTGLADPVKYAEVLATCETYINCMKEVCQHLTQEDIGVGDVQRVQDLLYQWGLLHALASDRHQQSQQLSVVSEAIGSMKKNIQSAVQCLSFELFSSKEELEATINTLRIKQEELDKQRQVLEEHQQVINTFLQHHPDINVSKYVEELQAVTKSTEDTQQRVKDHVQQLENNWAVWCQYLEGQQELDAMMARDRDRLYAMLWQREAGHPITGGDVLRELETLQNRLSVYESKLSVLQAMHQRLTRVSDNQTQRALLASLADLRNQLHVVEQRCRQMYRDVSEDARAEQDVVDHSQLGQLAVAPASLLESDTAKQTRYQMGCYDAEAAMGGGNTGLAIRRGGAWTWLRSVPVQIVALMMVAGLIYVLDPDILSDLANFSLTVTPELKHVNGPPPL